MLDETIFDAFIEIKKVLKEKYPKAGERYLYLLLMIIITIIPMVLFEYWIGRISGFVLVCIFFLSIVSSSRKKNKQE